MRSRRPAFVCPANLNFYFICIKASSRCRSVRMNVARQRAFELGTRVSVLFASGVGGTPGTRWGRRADLLCIKKWPGGAGGGGWSDLGPAGCFAVCEAALAAAWRRGQGSGGVAQRVAAWRRKIRAGCAPRRHPHRHPSRADCADCCYTAGPGSPHFSAHPDANEELPRRGCCSVKASAGGLLPPEICRAPPSPFFARTTWGARVMSVQSGAASSSFGRVLLPENACANSIKQNSGGGRRRSGPPARSSSPSPAPPRGTAAQIGNAFPP